MTWLQIDADRVELFYPKPEQITIERVSRSLSRLPRFCGHTSRPWTVAQHSLFVQHILREQGHPPVVQVLGLLHDASEMFTGDIPSPLKRHLRVNVAGTEMFLGTYEANLLDIIMDGLIWDKVSPAAYPMGGYGFVHSADRIALATERKLFLPPHPDPWDILESVEPFPEIPQRLFFQHQHSGSVRMQQAYAELMEGLL